MSQPALALWGADLEQEALSEQLSEHEFAAHEAQRLAELAASFCLFGLDIVLSEEAVRWPTASAAASAAAPYMAESPAAPAANDRHGFPTLEARGFHLPATAPARLIQGVDWIIVALTAEFAARWGANASVLDLPLGQAFGFVLSALSLKAGLWVTESYRVRPARIKADDGFGGLALGAMLGLLVATVFAPDARGAAALATTLPIAALLLAGAHFALGVWTRAAHAKGVFAETIVLVGATDAAERIARRAAHGGEARVVAIVDDRLARSPARVGDAPVGGNLDQLLAWDGLPNVDRIVITVTQKAEGRVREMIQRLETVPNRVDLLLDVQTHSVRGRGMERLGGAAVAIVSGRARSPARTFVKRAQDLVVGAVLLAAFALPMLIIALAVKCDSKGPALYRQRRLGFNNRTITILKFRSMRHDPGAPLAQVRANDPRITRIGTWLRRTSLDELPQLINVLRGDMSLVGPRPHAVGMKAADRELSDIVTEYAHRHRVKPGLTGWAQVNGSRGPVDSAAALRRRVRLDLEYVARASLWFDLVILLRTAPALLGDAATR